MYHEVKDNYWICSLCGKHIPFEIMHVCPKDPCNAAWVEKKRVKSKKSKWHKLRMKLPKKSGWYIVQTLKNEVIPVYFHQEYGWNIGQEISLWREMPKPSKE